MLIRWNLLMLPDFREPAASSGLVLMMDVRRRLLEPIDGQNLWRAICFYDAQEGFENDRHHIEFKCNFIR
jgi:hypothetical protein